MNPYPLAGAGRLLHTWAAQPVSGICGLGVCGSSWGGVGAYCTGPQHKVGCAWQS